MTDDTLLPFDLPSAARNSPSISKAAINLPMAVHCCCGSRSVMSVCAGGSRRRCRTARDPDHIQHQMVEMVTARVTAIACGYEDAIDHNDLRHDPVMKIAVGRCPESGAPLGSQSTISRLENAPSKTDAARLTVALVDQFGTTVTPGRMEMFD